jgi:hypothetical protein
MTKIPFFWYYDVALEHFGKNKIKYVEILKCGAAEGWNRSCSRTF